MELTGGNFKIEPHDVLANEQHAVGIYTLSASRGAKSLSWRHVNTHPSRV